MLGSRLRLVVDNGVVIKRPPLRAAGEIEVRLGACILGTFKPRARWRTGTAFVRQRLAEIERIIEVRHGGPCDTDDGELYLEAALPHLIVLPREAFPTSPVLLWAWTLCPHLVEARGRDWLEEREAELRARRRPVRLSADALAALLGVRDEERSRLRLRTIGAVDRPAEQRRADAKIRNRDRMRRVREKERLERQYVEQQTPRPPSISAVRPWQAEGISRSTWYARRAREAIGQPPCAIPSEALNRAHVAVQDSASDPVTGAPGRGDPRPSCGRYVA